MVSNVHKVHIYAVVSIVHKIHMCAVVSIVHKIDTSYEVYYFGFLAPVKLPIAPMI
jgi:hypothetical protein